MNKVHFKNPKHAGQESNDVTDVTDDTDVMVEKVKPGAP